MSQPHQRFGTKNIKKRTLCIFKW